MQRAIHGGQVEPPEHGHRRHEMTANSGAHAPLTNMVLAWNTNRMDGVVASLNRDGVGIKADWLRRIGAAHPLHINLRGTSSATRTCWSIAPPAKPLPSEPTWTV
jgi:hypothetical protein